MLEMRIKRRNETKKERKKGGAWLSHAAFNQTENDNLIICDCFSVFVFIISLFIHLIISFFSVCCSFIHTLWHFY